MTDKEFVLSMYPNAIVIDNDACPTIFNGNRICYSVFDSKNLKNRLSFYIDLSTEDMAWSYAARNIKYDIALKLES